MHESLCYNAARFSDGPQVATYQVSNHDEILKEQTCAISIAPSVLTDCKIQQLASGMIPGDTYSRREIKGTY